jgi:hypothetical protein
MADNLRLITNLFASMQKAIFLGDPMQKGEFVAFMAPGQFLDTSIKEGLGSDGMAIQSELSNVLIDTSFVNNRNDVVSGTSRELVGSVDRVYEDIIKHAALPKRALGPDLDKEIGNLRNWLVDNKKLYDQYSTLYEVAKSAYETEREKQTPNPVALSRLARAQTAAYRDWQTLGQKGLYEQKSARIIYLTQENPETLWADLGDTLNFHNQQSPNKGAYYSTFLVPPIQDWATASWSSFEEKVDEQDHYEYSKQTSWSGGLSGGWGLWSFGGGTGGSTSYHHKDDTATGATLKFEYLRVRIVRPWLASDVFGYKFWTWRSDFGFQYLSDGGNLSINPPLRPIGRMPVLPQYLIIVRNVELTANFSKEVLDEWASHVEHRASVGWGPFSVSGTYSESTQSKYVHAEFDGLTFRMAQPQIIARTGILLPRSPDPIPSLPWQGDQALPSSSTPSEFTERRAQDYAWALANERYVELRAKIEKEFEESLESARRRTLP